MNERARDRLESLTQTLALLERWREASGRSTFDDAIDRSSIEFEGLTRDFPIADIEALGSNGHRVELTALRGGWSVNISVRPGGRFEIDQAAGPIDEAFDDEQTIKAAEEARNSERARDLLELSGELDCRIRVTLQNEASETGFHWIRTGSALIDHVRRHTFLGVVLPVYESAGPHRIVIHDAGTGQAQAKDFVAHGPDVWPPDPPGVDGAAWDEYARTWLSDGRPRIPPPAALLPIEAEGIPDITDLLRSIAHALAWTWVASSVREDGRTIRVRFEASPDLEFDLTQLPSSVQAEYAVRLSEWSVATTDPARREALHQAVSLVVREPEALERSSERVLRTAKYLLRLARQGTVAEALAIRRSARQAASQAAQTAADSSRNASRSVVDRVLTQVVGAFGVLLANQAKLINATVAGWLLVGLLALSIATGLVALVFEFPAVTSALEAFDRDIETYSDMLTDEDLAQIKDMRGLAAARSQLRTARWISAALLAAAISVLVLARLSL